MRLLFWMDKAVISMKSANYKKQGRTSKTVLPCLVEQSFLPKHNCYYLTMTFDAFFPCTRM